MGVLPPQNTFIYVFVIHVLELHIQLCFNFFPLLFFLFLFLQLSHVFRLGLRTAFSMARVWPLLVIMTMFVSRCCMIDVEFFPPPSILVTEVKFAMVPPPCHFHG